MLQGLAIKILFKTISKVVEKIDDNKVASNHNKRLKALEEFSHPSQEYICCRRCGCEIAKSKKVKRQMNKIKERF
jgi:hypothetical protein